MKLKGVGRYRKFFLSIKRDITILAYLYPARCFLGSGELDSTISRGYYNRFRSLPSRPRVSGPPAGFRLHGTGKPRHEPVPLLRGHSQGKGVYQETQAPVS